jgi:Holliday junction resolvase RusA-like endonuclease
VIEFIVYGSPAPQGSKKFVGTTKTGRGIMVESSKKVRPWRQDVKAAAEAVRPAGGAIDGPLRVSMVFTLPKPASAPKRRRTWPDKKPDVSKLARSTEDAISDAGLWADDARVVEYSRLAKVFPGEDPDALNAPGVRIRIELLEPVAVQGSVLPPTPREEAEKAVEEAFG